MATRFFTPLRCVQNDIWDGGWVPAPVFTGGQDFDARTTGGGGRPLLRGGRMGGMRGGWIVGALLQRDSSTPLRSAQNDMWGALRCARNDIWVEEGQWVPAFARTRRGANRPFGGECCRARGSPPSPVFTRAGSNLPLLKGEGICWRGPGFFIVMTYSNDMWKGGWVPACARTMGGGWVVREPRLRGEGEGVMATRFFTPLRCVQNDMWEGRDGSPPPSSRGQDLDARTTGGGGRPPLRRGRMGVMRGWGTGGSRTALTRGANVIGRA